MSEVLVILAVVALATGAPVWLTVRRWPDADPVAPHVSTTTVQAELERAPRLRRLAARRPRPSTAALLTLSATTIALGAGVAVVGVLLIMVRTGTGLVAFDLHLAGWSARNVSDAGASALRLVTRLGATETMVVLGVAVGFAEYRRIPTRGLAGFVAVALAGTVAVTNLVKWLVGRARPDLAPLTEFSGDSFPSGHTSTAAVTFAVLALLIGRRRSIAVKAALAGTAAAVTGAVAASRVLLGVHWLTDVIGGAALGWAWFALCSILFGGRLLRFGAPVEVAERVAATGDEKPGEAGAA